jgi:2-haloacid dehalogenase
MQPALITFDAFAALVDYRSSLLPVVAGIEGLDSADASSFLELWRGRQLAVAGLSNALQRERIPFRECTALALDYSLARHGLELGCDERAHLVRAWYRLEPWPEANRVLSACRAKGYPLAILSNGDTDMLESLASGLEVSFDHIFSSEGCGRYKPHPRVYAMPADELGIEDYLHVAGSPNDAIGARAAGVSCYWSNRQSDCVILPDYTPDHQGPDLTGILDIV